MPDYPAKVARVYSGIVLDTLGFFANTVHPVDDLSTYGFKVIKIKHRDGGDPSVDTTLAGEKGNTSDGISCPMEELRRRQHRRDGSRRSQSSSRTRRQSSTAYTSDIEQVYQIRQQPREKSVDPMSETFTGLTEERPVVTPKWSSPTSIISAASFVLTGVIIGMMVYCKDGVALLAVGIVSLASMIPKEHHWNLSRYEWTDVTPRDARHADRTTDPSDACDGFRSFTRALWYAIRETKSTRWAERSGAAPGTRRWRQWLREAEENARAGNRRWAAVRRRDHIFADDESDAMR